MTLAHIAATPLLHHKTVKPATTTTRAAKPRKPDLVKLLATLKAALATEHETYQLYLDNSETDTSRTAFNAYNRAAKSWRAAEGKLLKALASHGLPLPSCGAVIVDNSLIIDPNHLFTSDEFPEVLILDLSDIKNLVFDLDD